ncbi:MAG: nucleotidyl transferase AbiEii/AbiGii toxin family protein, partial [Actinobacteria bacterium]|nr:nucleotidyl transferase AbiEii/AbiGii toxin family protein [Actinomycetota bacterium]
RRATPTPGWLTTRAARPNPDKPSGSPHPRPAAQPGREQWLKTRQVSNTRWRDFADVYLLSRAHGQDGGELVTAITRVARHRQVALGPLTTSLAGFPRLAQSRWAAWRRRQLLDGLLPEDFAEVLDAVTVFADKCLQADASPGVWDVTAQRWTPGSEPLDGRTRARR